jgi:hypothetical protein
VMGLAIIAGRKLCTSILLLTIHVLFLTIHV